MEGNSAAYVSVDERGSKLDDLRNIFTYTHFSDGNSFGVVLLRFFDIRPDTDLAAPGIDKSVSCADTVQNALTPRRRSSSRIFFSASICCFSFRTSSDDRRFFFAGGADDDSSIVVAMLAAADAADSNRTNAARAAGPWVM